VTTHQHDRERFEVLYRTHYAAVVRFVRRRADPATAEDVVAETFATAWRRLDRVPDEPLPWLFVTARNVLRNAHRAAARQRGAGEAPGLARDPADVLGERDTVLRAFAALSPTDREALRLVAWDGLALADGARVAGTTRLAFAMRVSRARRRLASALDELESGHPAPTRPLEARP